jgi:DNA ligase-associated metallophosphoesterase
MSQAPATNQLANVPPHEPREQVSPASCSGCNLTIAGQSVTLLPHRAAFWHERKTLLISDLHLGKVETFASFGVPLPDVMQHQLAALSAVINATACERVLILGDLLHAPAGLTTPMMETVRDWRAKHACEFAVVPGNHDRHLEKVADWWNMRVLGEVHREGPFAFTHEPRPIANALTWAGHIHPVYRMRSASDTLKLWCFTIDETQGIAVLPAFCDFTSGGRFERHATTRVFVIAQGQVLEV